MPGDAPRASLSPAASLHCSGTRSEAVSASQARLRSAEERRPLPAVRRSAPRRCFSPGKVGLVLVFVLALWLCFGCVPARSMSPSHRLLMRARVSSMFEHGYSSYLRYAFPHDELRPLSRSFTDSLAELGNAARPAGSSYEGVALTLIDSLSTLAVMGRRADFEDGIARVRRSVHFNVSVRVNVFEANIRLLGGLLSAHVLAKDRRLNLTDHYHDDALLTLAVDLGRRLLPAFDTPTGIPYAWVNLRTGVEAGETREQCTAGVGTLLMEFALLSYLSRDDVFYRRADAALSALLAMRSPLGLFGNTLTVDRAQWTNANAGIGAGVDSFYEYLLKSYVLLGSRKYLHAFDAAYGAVLRHLRHGHWYIEADMNSGAPQHLQFQSLHSFFPGLQSAAGRLPAGARLLRRLLLPVDALPGAARALRAARAAGAQQRALLPAQAGAHGERLLPVPRGPR